jgi:hypothetical protein
MPPGVALQRNDAVYSDIRNEGSMMAGTLALRSQRRINLLRWWLV